MTSKFDQDKFIADFNRLNFAYLDDNQSNASANFSRFLGNVDEIVKKHAPLKKLTKNDLKLRNKPWINSRIQKMMRLRDKLLKRVRKRPDAATKHLYKQFRNHVAVKLKEGKKNTFTIILMSILTI